MSGLVVAGAKTGDEQLRALVAAAVEDVALPADAFVLGEPVQVTAIEYGGTVRRGLSAVVRRGVEAIFRKRGIPISTVAGERGIRRGRRYDRRSEKWPRSRDRRTLVALGR